MVKKYLCAGGYVRSNNDGELHYVNAMNVMRLYKLLLAECLLVEADSMPYAVLGVNRSQYIILRPGSTGKYQLPKP